MRFRVCVSTGKISKRPARASCDRYNVNDEVHVSGHTDSVRRSSGHKREGRRSLDVCGSSKVSTVRWKSNPTPFVREQLGPTLKVASERGDPGGNKIGVEFVARCDEDMWQSEDFDHLVEGFRRLSGDVVGIGTQNRSSGNIWTTLIWKKCSPNEWLLRSCPRIFGNVAGTVSGQFGKTMKETRTRLEIVCVGAPSQSARDKLSGQSSQRPFFKRGRELIISGKRRGRVAQD